MLKDLLKIWKLVKPFHRLLILLFITQMILAAMDSLFTVIQGYLIANLIKYDIESFKYWIMLFVILNIIYWTLDYIHDYQWAKRFDRNIRQFLQEYSLNKLFSLTISQTIENNSAIRQDIVNRGEDAIKYAIILVVRRIVFTVGLLVFSIGTVFYYNTLFGIFNIIIFIIILSWGLWFNKYYNPIREKLNEIWISQRKTRQEAFTHVSLIKSLGQESLFVKKYLKNRKDLVNYSIDRDLIHERHNGRRNYFLSSVHISTYILLAFLFLKEDIQVASVYIISTNIIMSIFHTRNLYQLISELILEHVNIKKFLDFVELQPNFDENGKNLDFKNGDIEFKNFSFTYPSQTKLVKDQELDDNYDLGEIDSKLTEDNKPIIKDLNITIKENSKVAFVGHSGSGKSTIIKLLLKYYDYDNTNSKISINNIDIRDMNAGNLRQNIGYVEQNVDLFDSTLKENILFGLKEEDIDKMTEDDILTRLEEVCKLARIDTFYDRLGEKKFETLLGEKGIKLSGGERQRVGIARAIIRDPKILIMDEATASLDTINENYIKEAIQQVSQGRTTIIVAHRLSTVIDSDKIFVMEKGQIVGEGTHKELLDTNKYYQELIQGQELI